MTIATKQLPSAIIGTPYVAVLDASGGTPNYTWSIAGGQLPSGVSLAPSTGILSGTPTVSGNFSFDLTLADASNPSQTKATAITIAVAAPALNIADSAIISATVGTPYSQTLQASGGAAPYSWSIKSGRLPAGLSLTPSTGVISGTPTTATGGAKLTATVHDSGRPTQTYSVAIGITVAPAPLKIMTVDLPSATSGAAYTQSLQVSGGTPTYKWSIASGSLPAGLTLRPNGTIYGISKTSGTSTFTASVSDSSSPNENATQPITISVEPSQLEIRSAAQFSAIAGHSFSYDLSAKGGTPGYMWSITSGSLPAGLSLNPTTGLISGTLTASGTSNFVATVSDNGNPRQNKSVPMTFVVAPLPLKITSSALPMAAGGKQYSQTLHATGGAPGYKWSITSGKLPSGMNLDQTSGTISGTPMISGAAAFTATVNDSSSPTQAASAPITVVVAPSPLTIVAATLPNGTSETGYSQTLQASGGTPTYTWSVTSGTLPAGLTLSTSGVVSGTPARSGSSTFTATVSDSGSPAQSVSTAVAIVVAPRQLSIVTATSPSGTSRAPYSQTLSAIGGTLSYTWTVTSGSLPAGLTLSASGVISGTPTASGTSNFTATVSDSGSPVQTASTATAITIAPSPLTITTSSLVSATSGNAYSQSLQASGGTPSYTWTITSGSLPAGITLSSGGLISGTPSGSGITKFPITSSFTATVSDSGSPAQATSVAMSLAVAAPTIPPLTITSSALASGTNGTAYSQSLQANGGTPAYTWSITSGSLPSGLTMAATTGAISGTPTAIGTTNFTATVTDNGNPAQTNSIATSIAVVAQKPSSPGTTWFVRADGGPRYDATYRPTGASCNGQSDTAFNPAGGPNQSCAYQELQFLWDTGTGIYTYHVGWVIAGGDTVVIRGCTAYGGQQNPSNPNCRIGWSASTGIANIWCAYVGSYTCYNPPIPAGSAGAHTRILGGCAYDGSCTPIGNNYPYGTTNETQLFGGFSLTWTFNLAGTHDVDIEGIELTTHNGQCVKAGYPAYPRGCSGNQPVDDYAQNGIVTDNTTANVTLQDVYIHGFNSAGLYGPIGGAITATRLFTGFNGFAGWNFADTADTPDAPGSSITASYVTMIGNGCYEQYPIVSSTFPAQACYDDLSQGFGDAWSGQDTPLDTLVCDHCIQKYNTKDGFIGPHTQIKHLTITNSASIGNMGEQWKFGTDTNATVVFENNLTEGNSYRMGAALPGAVQNFSLSSGLPGSYLSDFGRAGGDMFSIITQAGSSLQFSGNSMVLASQTGMDFNCGLVNHAGSVTGGGTCGAVPIVWTNNLFVGYTDPNCGSCGGLAPGLWYQADSSINFTSSYNLEFGIRNGDKCGTNNILCTDPLLQNEPGQTWPGSEAALDVFDPANPNSSFHPAKGSPLIGAGTAVNGLASDYYGVAQPSTPTIGAVAK